MTDFFRVRVPRAARQLRVLFMGGAALDHGIDDLAGRGDPPIGSKPPSVRLRRDQFDDFYRVHYASVVRLAYSLCGSMTIAEELAQEAFVTAHGRWRRITTFDRPDLWVRRVVINRSISFRRKEAAERRAVDRFSRRRPDQSDREEPVVADDDVWRALRELSPRQAEVLALVYVEDQPIAEVAAILGLGEETIRTHLKRGRVALAARLSKASEVTDRAAGPTDDLAPRQGEVAR